MLVVGIDQLPGTRCLAVGTVDMVAQHQEKRFVPDHLPDAVNCMPKALLSSCSGKGYPASDLQQALGILLEMDRKLVVVLNGHLDIEEVCGKLPDRLPGR